MIFTEDRRDQAQTALWGIPGYLDNEVGAADSLLKKIMVSVRKAKPEQPSMEAGRSEGLDAFRVYGSIGRQLDQLLKEQESDEFGRIRPAIAAVAYAKDRLFKMAQGLVLPDPEDVSTDRDGALRISWRGDARFLELIFPYETDIRPYVYYSQGALFEISEDMSDRKLLGWAAWIAGGGRPE
jgi:hypothetical protein